METENINISLADVLDNDCCPELLGANPRPRVVGVAVNYNEVYIWQRCAIGEAEPDSQPVRLSIEKFRPYIWMHHTKLNEVRAYDEECTYESKQLSGTGFFNSIVSANNIEELATLNKEITSINKEVKKEFAASHFGEHSALQLYNNDLVNLYLTKAGFCLFNGLNFKEILRLGLTVFTSCGNGENLHGCTEESIGCLYMHLSDGREKLLCLDDYEGDEAKLLKDFVQNVKNWDPDIIEGHFLYDDILPYLQARAKAVKVKLLLGREFIQADKKRSVPKGVCLEPKGRKTYTTIANKRYDYIYWDLWGRELVDTLMLARLRDVTFRELETFSLEETAQSLGTMGEDEPAFASEREKAEFYGHLLEKVSEALLYPFYVQAQFFPYSLQNTILRGTATKINSLFLRYYLSNSVSIPDKPQVAEYMGASAGQEVEGIVHDVYHCDVQSLYPSIMLSCNLGPQADELGLFLNLLAKLRTFRLKAKALMRQVQKEAEQDVERIRFYDALQSTFKILINSFYGYLGFAQGNFADFAKASEVTAKGREILATIISKLKELGCRVVEYDTDGVYFQAAPESEEAPEVYGNTISEAINSILPSGVGVELDGFYPSMYSHTTKNYVLLDKNGTLSFSGATFRSRSREPYLRLALQRTASFVLQGRPEEAVAYIAQLKDDILKHNIPITMLAKTEILNDSLENYGKKIEKSSRNRAAAYEVALKSKHTYAAGKAVRYYITGNKKSVRIFENAKELSLYDASAPDENSAYYIGKLEALLEQFPLLVPAEALPVKKSRSLKK